MIPLLLLALAQPPATVQGTVRAADSREPITYATVRLPELERSVPADQHGYFVVAGVPAGTWRVRAHAPGYAPHEVTMVVPGEGVVRIDLELEPRPIELPPVEIVTRRTGAGDPGELGVRHVAGPAEVRLTAAAMDRIPALAEADVFRALQTLPSVAAASDFSTALYVRGGAPDQNLVLLDGAPVFNPFHLAGLFAAFDPDAVASVGVRPGALPAEAGDRLSSTIEVWTRDGGRDRVRTHGSVGVVSSRLGADGPLPGGRGSYLVSGRRTYLDLATRAARATGATGWELPYAFSDLHLKLTRDVGEMGRLSVSMYLNDERLHTDRGDGAFGNAAWDWGSRLASVRYRQPWRGKWLLEGRAAASGFGAALATEEELAGAERLSLDARSRMEDVLLGFDLSRYGGAHRLRFGAQLDRYRFRHEIDNRLGGGDLSPFVPPLGRSDRFATVAGYVEDTWTPFDALSLRAGVRVLHAGGRGTEWMPRLGARLALSSRFSLVAGGGRYAQAVHSLRDEEARGASLFAYELLGAAEPRMGLPVATDATVGAEWASAFTAVRVDAFTRHMSRLALPPLPSEPMEAPVLVAGEFLPATGTSRGVEVMARHARGRREVSLSYALLFAERRVDGTSYVPRFERRHTLDLSGVAPLGARGQATARAVLGTGQPYSPFETRYRLLPFDPRTGGFGHPGGYGGHGGEMVVLGPHNSARLPGYFRLDVAARRSFERTWFGRKVEVTPYVQLFNVLNTRNVFWAEPTTLRHDGSSGPPRLDWSWQLPVVPTLGVEWRS